MNTSGLLQSKWSPKYSWFQIRSIHDSTKIQKIEVIAYIYIYY